MRYIYILTILSLTLYSCSNFKFIDRQGFKSNPKIVESSWFKIIKKDTLFEKKLINKDIYYFDKKGRTIKNLCYKSDSSKCYSKKYNYDKYGNIIEYIYGKDSTVVRHNKFVFNKKGKLLSEESTGIDKITNMVFYKYDKNGNNIEELIMNEDNTFIRKSVFEYNQKNQRVSLKSFNENGTPKEGKITISYDIDGNEYESRVYDLKDRLMYFYREDYDKFNNKILTEKYSIKGKDTILSSASKIEYIYDEKGNVIKETHFNQKKEPSWVYEHEISY